MSTTSRSVNSAESTTSPHASAAVDVNSGCRFGFSRSEALVVSARTASPELRAHQLQLGVVAAVDRAGEFFGAKLVPQVAAVRLVEHPVGGVNFDLQERLHVRQVGVALGGELRGQGLIGPQGDLEDELRAVDLEELGERDRLAAAGARRERHGGGGELGVEGNQAIDHRLGPRRSLDTGGVGGNFGVA